MHVEDFLIEEYLNNSPKERLANKVIQEHNPEKAQLSISVSQNIEIEGTPESYLMLSRLLAAQAIGKGMSPFGWNSILTRPYVTKDSKYTLSFNLKQVKQSKAENNFTEEDFTEVLRRAHTILNA